MLKIFKTNFKEDLIVDLNELDTRFLRKKDNINRSRISLISSKVKTMKSVSRKTYKQAKEVIDNTIIIVEGSNNYQVKANRLMNQLEHVVLNEPLVEANPNIDHSESLLERVDKRIDDVNAIIDYHSRALEENRIHRNLTELQIKEHLSRRADAISSKNQLMQTHAQVLRSISFSNKQDMLDEQSKISKETDDINVKVDVAGMEKNATQIQESRESSKALEGQISDIEDIIDNSQNDIDVEYQRYMESIQKDELESSDDEPIETINTKA